MGADSVSPVVGVAVAPLWLLGGGFGLVARPLVVPGAVLAVLPAARVELTELFSARVVHVAVALAAAWRLGPVTPLGSAFRLLALACNSNSGGMRYFVISIVSSMIVPVFGVTGFRRLVDCLARASASSSYGT